MTVPNFARALGLGRLAYLVFHRPVGAARTSLRNGRPLAERESERQRAEMELAAYALPALPSWPGATDLRVHLLTGRRFWYQTSFYLHSLASTATANLQIESYDDGTLDETRFTPP